MMKSLARTVLIVATGLSVLATWYIIQNYNYSAMFFTGCLLGGLLFLSFLAFNSHFLFAFESPWPKMKTSSLAKSANPFFPAESKTP